MVNLTTNLDIWINQLVSENIPHLIIIMWPILCHPIMWLSCQDSDKPSFHPLFVWGMLCMISSISAAGCITPVNIPRRSLIASQNTTSPN